MFSLLVKLDFVAAFKFSVFGEEGDGVEVVRRVEKSRRMGLNDLVLRRDFSSVLVLEGVKEEKVKTELEETELFVDLVVVVSMDVAFIVVFRFGDANVNGTLTTSPVFDVSFLVDMVCIWVLVDMQKL